MTSPFDSITGGHRVAIDLSDDTDAGFYSDGDFYEVWLVPDETVDTQSVVKVLACFSIGVQSAKINRAGFDPDTGLQSLRSGTAQAGGATTITLDAGASAVDDFYNDDSVLTVSGTGAGQFRVITDYNGTTKVATVDSAWAVNPASDTGFALFPAAATVADIQAGLATAAQLSAFESRMAGLVSASGTIGSTGNGTTTLHLPDLAYGNDEINNMLLVIFDASNLRYHARWVEDWVNATALATVATLPFTPENAVDTYWLLPVRSDVTGGSGLDAAGVRAAIGMATANLDTQLGDLPTNAELTTALGTADDAVLTRLGTPAGASIAADILTLDNLVDDLESRIGTPANLGGGATIAQNLSDIEAQTDDIGAAGAGLTALGDTRIGNLDAAVSTRVTPAQVATELATYDGPTNAEMVARTLASADYATAANLSTAQTGIDAIPTNAELATALAAADDAVLAAIAALNNLSSADVLTQVNAGLDATVADSVPADGSRPSLRQAAYLNTQFLLERSVSGTTLTIRKPDGSTTLITCLLNDATSPTSVSRSA